MSGECAAPVVAACGLGLKARGGQSVCSEARVGALPRLGPAPGDFASLSGQTCGTWPEAVTPVALVGDPDESQPPLPRRGKGRVRECGRVCA